MNIMDKAKEFYSTSLKHAPQSDMSYVNLLWSGYKHEYYFHLTFLCMSVVCVHVCVQVYT